MADDLCDLPIEVVALGEAVVILAPQGPVALTAWAALQSAQRLVDAARSVLDGTADPLEEDYSAADQTGSPSLTRS